MRRSRFKTRGWSRRNRQRSVIRSWGRDCSVLCKTHRNLTEQVVQSYIPHIIRMNSSQLTLKTDATKFLKLLNRLRENLTKRSVYPLWLKKEWTSYTKANLKTSTSIFLKRGLKWVARRILKAAKFLGSVPQIEWVDWVELTQSVWVSDPRWSFMGKGSWGIVTYLSRPSW